MWLFTAVGVVFAKLSVVNSYTRRVFNLGVMKLFNGQKSHVVSLLTPTYTSWRLTKLSMLHSSVCFSLHMHVYAGLTSAYTSDCRRKGQQPDMATMFVLILRTSLRVSRSNSQWNNKHSLRQVSYGSYLWSSHIPSLSQKAHRSHHSGSFTDPSLRIWQQSSIPSSVVM